MDIKTACGDLLNSGSAYQIKNRTITIEPEHFQWVTAGRLV